MPLGTNMDITYHFYYIYISATSCRSILSKILKKALQAPKKATPTFVLVNEKTLFY